MDNELKHFGFVALGYFMVFCLINLLGSGFATYAISENMLYGACVVNPAIWTFFIAKARKDEDKAQAVISRGRLTVLGFMAGSFLCYLIDQKMGSHFTEDHCLQLSMLSAIYLFGECSLIVKGVVS